MTRAARWALAAITLASASPAAAETLFRFPGSDDDRPHFYVTAYRDLASGELQDWACGDTTYGGHTGTDFGAGGFAGMDEGRDIVAAADGVVTFVHDGVFDRCTSGSCGGGGGFGNYVEIEHDDGKVTYYGHLKKHSITVSVGDEVSCGQTLGQMGSSGNSTGPHLHFEPRVNGSSDDPFRGPCGGPVSWWVEQGEYRALPEPQCQDRDPSHPVIAMDTELVSEAEGDPSSLRVGEEATARVFVSASEASARDVVLGIEGLGDVATILEWQVFDDFAENDCGGAMCPNDANGHPDNPPHERPGDRWDLHLSSLSPGETKMVELKLRADAPTESETPGAPLRAWVKEIPGSYQKTSYDSEPQNENDAQTFNGGDLKQAIHLGVAERAGGGEDDPRPPSGARVSGGCSAAAGSSSTLAHVLFLFALGVSARFKSGRGAPPRLPFPWARRARPASP